MKHLYSSLLFIAFLLASLPLTQAVAQSDSLSSAAFDLNACDANFGLGEQFNYSELTANVDNSGACADLQVTSGNVYVEDPEENPHSCTPGMDGNPALCISSQRDCSYNPDADEALRFDVRVTPGETGVAILSSLSFYEQAPPTFTWINGSSGPNNYPTLFRVRVTRMGEEVFRSAAMPTQQSWNLRTFDFSEVPEFTVMAPVTFSFEILPYCIVGNGAVVTAWDIDNISVESNCCLLLEGGELSGGPFEFCVGDGVADTVSGVEISGNVGSKGQYVVTDEEGVILGLPDRPEDVNFDEAGPGTCLIWHVSYFGTLPGLEMGNNAMTDLEGDCFAFSNSVTVIRNEQPEGGELSGGPFTFCVGDGMPDFVSGVEVSGNTGENSQWVVTDEGLNILALPAAPDSVDFDGAGPGICLIWHLSYDGSISGAEVGANAADLMGCFALSDSVVVNRNEQPEGGELSGGPFEFCVGDGVADMVSGVELTGATGSNSQYVVTDTSLNILGLPAAPEDVNFDDAGPGICLIWHLAYEGDITGVEMGANVADVTGCFGLSNSVTVVRNQPNGGELTGGPFEFCVGDSIGDFVSGVELSGASGENSQYVVTDTNLVILGLPASPEDVNFEEAGPGVCLIWHLSYDGMLTGAEVGNNVSDIVGCFGLSNSITVNRSEPAGGMLTGGPWEFCIDSVPNFVDSIELTGNVGTSQWVITDTVGVILALPTAIDSVDFNESGPGVCLIWNLSYVDSLGGAEIGANAADLTGCFGLSNPLTVTRLEQPCEDSITSGGPVLDVAVFPNPGIDRVNLHFTNAGDETVNVTIYDIYGRPCISEICGPYGAQPIDVSHLDEGQYYVVVQNKRGKQAKSLIIVR